MAFAFSNMGSSQSGQQSSGEMTGAEIDEYLANNPIELNLDEAIAWQSVARYARGIGYGLRAALGMSTAAGENANNEGHPGSHRTA